VQKKRLQCVSAKIMMKYTNTSTLNMCINYNVESEREIRNTSKGVNIPFFHPFFSFPSLLYARSVSCFIIHRYRDGGRGAAGGAKQEVQAAGEDRLRILRLDLPMYAQGHSGQNIETNEYLAAKIVPLPARRKRKERAMASCNTKSSCTNCSRASVAI
jgi:hypothetical protein